MQNQPKSDEARVGRVQRARQAIRVDDDAFKGGEDAPNPRLGLKRPWVSGRSRPPCSHDTEAGAE
jgi:hypothetical protein